MRRSLLVFLTSLLPLSGFSASDYPKMPSTFFPDGELNHTQLNNDQYELVVDKHFSPHASSVDLLSLHRSLELVDEVLGPNDENRLAFSSKLTRSTELFMVWLPLNYMTTVVQHEIFGHGYRIRDLGKARASVEDYSFNLPPPYGPGGAATMYSYNPANFSSPQEYNAIAIGGVEANGILANTMKEQWVEKGAFSARQSMLYLFAQHDISMYVSSLGPEEDDEEDGHDINRYLKMLQLTYPGYTLSKNSLKRMARIGIFDPFSYIALYGWFHYTATGKETPLPMFHFDNFSYLPSARLGLTPFGPEYIVDNYIRYKDKPAYFYLKDGKFAGNRYLGLGIHAPELFSHRCHSLGLKLDLWRQPKLLTRQEWLGENVSRINPNTPFDDINPSLIPSNAAKHDLVPGFAASGIYNFQMQPSSFSFHLELGYKSQGFLPGESLRSGPLAKIALSARF